MYLIVKTVTDPQNIGQAALELLNDLQANVLAKELQAWCMFVARR